jgi:Domain of unknown function (DUF5658)
MKFYENAMNMNKVVALIAVVALNMSTLAVAAENEDRPLVSSVEAAASSGFIPIKVSVKRPGILPMLYVSLAGMQALDAYTTLAALNAGGREVNPVARRLTRNAGSLLSLKAVSTASTIYFMERLWKSHRLRAVFVLSAINAGTVAVAVRNMRTVRMAAGRR